MDRWAVYEYVKNYYYRCGRIPSPNILVFEFPNVPREEIQEGLTEFELVLRRVEGETQLERSHARAIV